MGRIFYRNKVNESWLSPNPNRRYHVDKKTKRSFMYEPKFDKDGFDQYGIDKDGYDKKGKDFWGFKRDGYNSKGYDRYGYNRKGFNADGVDKEGYNKKGFKNGYNRDGESEFDVYIKTLLKKSKAPDDNYLYDNLSEDDYDKIYCVIDKIIDLSQPYAWKDIEYEFLHNRAETWLNYHNIKPKEYDYYTCGSYPIYDYINDKECYEFCSPDLVTKDYKSFYHIDKNENRVGPIYKKVYYDDYLPIGDKIIFLDDKNNLHINAGWNGKSGINFEFFNAFNTNDTLLLISQNKNAYLYTKSSGSIFSLWDLSTLSLNLNFIKSHNSKWGIITIPGNNVWAYHGVQKINAYDWEKCIKSIIVNDSKHYKNNTKSDVIIDNIPLCVNTTDNAHSTKNFKITDIVCYGEDDSNEIYVCYEININSKHNKILITIKFDKSEVYVTDLQTDNDTIDIEESIHLLTTYIKQKCYKELKTNHY